MCFVRNGSLNSFETCTITIGMSKNLRVCRVCPSKYKGKWCFSPKCVLSETDHHTALKLVPFETCTIGSSTPENLRHAQPEFVPLNTKESDVLAQNVFSQKQIIIQLWNLYHCNCSMPENLRVYTEFGPLNTKESDVLAQNVFSQKWIIKQLWNLYHCDCSMPENLRVHWVLALWIQKKVMF